MNRGGSVAGGVPARGPVSRAGRRPGRRLVAAVAAVLLVGSLAGYGAAGAYGRQSLVVRPLCDGREFARQTPADFVASDAGGRLDVDAAPYRFSDYADVAFPARGDGVTIRGWYAPGPDGTADPVVVLANGIYSCRRDSVTLLPAAMLHRAGFGVLVIDLRNHGDSDADNGVSALGAKEYRDLLGAWDWLVARGHAPQRIGLFGTSLSAASALIAMAEEPAVAATWADSSFADVEVLLGEQAEDQGFPAWLARAIIPVGRLMGEPALGTRSPDRAVERLGGRRLAIVHGLADTRVRPHHALDLVLAAAGAGTLVEPWLVPGAGHQEEVLVRPGEYETRLVAFFEAALVGAG